MTTPPTGRQTQTAQGAEVCENFDFFDSDHSARVY